MSFESDLNELNEKFGATKIPLNGVEFVGKSLKLDNEADAKPVIDAINNLEGPLEFLNLEGNTIGVDAAKAIAKALEDKPTLRHALWKDMFTGRLKSEIPLALAALSDSLMLAGARLEILDLSDNASGPIGVDGIAKLLSSEVCYGLKELRLANMGLGIYGAQKLAAALNECCDKSIAAGKPFALKVFIAGRNRLEFEGSVALSKVFKRIKSLEEVQIYQNGIYHAGLKKLCEAFKLNTNLRIININDNTMGFKGAEYLCDALRNLPNLTTLDVGDCLLRVPGTNMIAEVIRDYLPRLEKVVMSGNEINGEAGLNVAEALATKKNLKSVQLDENAFGSKLDDIKNIIKKGSHKNKNLTVSITDDEGSADEDDDGEEAICSDGEEEAEDEEEGGSYEEELDHNDDEYDDDYDEEEEDGDSDGYSNEDYPTDLSYHISPMHRNFDQNNGIFQPASNLIANKCFTTPHSFEQLLKTIEGLPINEQLEELLLNIMLVAKNGQDPTSENLGVKLYTQLISVAEKSKTLHLVNNLLPAYLGLIKFEKKKDLGKQFDSDSSVRLVKKAIASGVLPKDTVNILNFLFPRGSEANNN